MHPFADGQGVTVLTQAHNAIGILEDWGSLFIDAPPGSHRTVANIHHCLGANPNINGRSLDFSIKLEGSKVVFRFLSLVPLPVPRQQAFILFAKGNVVVSEVIHRLLGSGTFDLSDVENFALIGLFDVQAPECFRNLFKTLNLKRNRQLSPRLCSHRHRPCWKEMATTILVIDVYFRENSIHLV